MYSIFEINGEQYIGEKGKELKIDKLDKVPENKELIFDKVLLYRNGDKILIGTPYLNNVLVKATYLRDIKDKKVIVFKYKRRKRYRRKKGHRQEYSVIRINEIELKEWLKSFFWERTNISRDLK